MRAYKFRSAGQLALALDIVYHCRLYCSDWETLNDPLESLFMYSYLSPSDQSATTAAAKAVQAAAKLLKVCSLSQTFDSHLLWAHYAEGFTGLAVEVEVPDAD